MGRQQIRQKLPKDRLKRESNNPLEGNKGRRWEGVIDLLDPMAREEEKISLVTLCSCSMLTTGTWYNHN